MLGECLVTMAAWSPCHGCVREGGGQERREGEERWRGGGSRADDRVSQMLFRALWELPCHAQMIWSQTNGPGPGNSASEFHYFL